MRKKISKHTISLNAVKTNPGLDWTISCQPFSVLQWLQSMLYSRILWNKSKNVISELIITTVHSVIWNLLDSLFLIDLAPCLTGVGRRCSFGHRNCMGHTTPSLLALPRFSLDGEMPVCLESLTLTNESMAPECKKNVHPNIIQTQPSWALTAICLLVVHLFVARIIKLLPSGRQDHRIHPGFSLQGKIPY